MIQILKQIHQTSKHQLSSSQIEQINNLKSLTQQHAYKIVVEDIQQKQYMNILLEKATLLIGQELNETNQIVQNLNIRAYDKICAGQIEVVKYETGLSSSRLMESKVMITQSNNKSFVHDRDEEKRKVILAKQLIKKKQEEKAERHSRLEMILQKQSQIAKLKEEQEQKNRNNIIWMRKQKSLQKYRLIKQKHDQEEVQRQSKLSSIKQFQNKIKSISRASEVDFSSLDVQRNKQLQNSRTQALILKKNLLKVDYRDIDEHDQKYVQRLKGLETDRLHRFHQRKSQDINAMKLIKPFNEVYLPKDTLQQARQKTSKIKQFKDYVKLHIKPTIDMQKRRSMISSIISQDANRYRSLGIVKQEVNGRIVEKQLPKINLRSIGNEYMQHAKKLKSKLQHKTQILQQQVIQKPKLTNYLIDLKREERRRMSRSQQIQKSQLPMKQKVKRIRITIQCLENQIKKHQTLMRNSTGLPSGKIEELQEAVDNKNLQIANLKLTLMDLFNQE